MPVDISIEGADELARVGRQLRQVADKELRKELLAGLNRATKPLKESAKRSAQTSLPRRGGLAAKVAGSRFATRSRLSGRDPSVRITAKGMDLRSLDTGSLRHPVFGNRKVWVTQRVARGWFSKPIESGADEVRREILNVLEDITRRLARG